MTDIYEAPGGTLNHRPSGRKAKIDDIYPDPAAWYPTHRVVSLFDAVGGLVRVEQFNTERAALRCAERWFGIDPEASR